MPSAPGEGLAQPRDPRAPRCIGATSDAGDNRSKDPLRDLLRCREGNTWIDHGKPGRMQRHCPREKSIPFALLRHPFGAAPADLAAPYREICTARNRVRAAQARPLKGGVAIARVGDEGLAFGLEQRPEAV